MKKTVFAMLLCLALWLAQAALADSTAEIDVDLTQVDSGSVIDALYDMMDAPEANQGKTAKLRGYISFFPGLEDDTTLFYLQIDDPYSCCAQQFEFIPASEPEDMDAIEFSDDEFIVVGSLDFFENGGYTDVRLIDAQILLLDA